MSRLHSVMRAVSYQTRTSELPFSSNLRRLLKERQVTLNEICEISGVAKSVAHGWVNGATPRDLRAVARLSDSLQIGFRELLLGDTDRSLASESTRHKTISEKEIFEHLCELLIQKIKIKERL